MLKRTFDVIVALVGIIITFPIFVICAILIKINSKGPIIFRQKRVGKNENIFTLFKFRTMRFEANQNSAKITRKNDARITSVGQILRWSKLDELPQLLNVFKGDMSFVGPRPEIPEIVVHYSEVQKNVLSVRPGIIGPAQIYGRNESDAFPDDVEDTEKYYIEQILPKKIKIDLNYIEKSRFLYDLKLLLSGIWITIIGASQAQVFMESKISAILLPLDVFLVSLSYTLAYNLRFEWVIPAEEMKIFLISLPIVVLVQMLSFLIFRIYKSLWRYISIEDLISIFKATTLGTIITVVIIFFIGLRVASRSVFFIDWILTFLFIGGVRSFLRIAAERASSKKPTKIYENVKKNILIIGAGDLGEMVLREINRNGKYQYNVIGLVDDDEQKLGKEIHGVKVLGTREDIHQIARITRVDEAYIAINELSSNEIKSILALCEKTNLKYRIVSAAIDSFDGNFQFSKIRNIEVSDLFGRKPVALDFTAIRKFIFGKSILVTGAGGSIGSELCRQIVEYNPQSIVLVDRNENYLHAVQTELETNFPKLYMSFIIADITNRVKIEKIFKKHQPEIVFHAAAQKHVPLSESNPDEAVLNNVIGTQILARTAHKYQIDQFVMISSDKAVNPANVMGASKRLAELFIRSFSRNSLTKFVIVRFGNVMGSNGSVVPTFLKQIEKGGPVTVTHPEIVRYFMSIFEAVQLVIQAVTMGKNGEIFILEMGEQIKIIDLAKELIRRAGLIPDKDIHIKFTGIRPGEKMFEELVAKNEDVLKTSHEQVRVLKSNNVVNVEVYDREISILSKLVKKMDNSKIKEKLRELVPEFSPQKTDDIKHYDVNASMAIKRVPTYALDHQEKIYDNFIELSPTY